MSWNYRLKRAAAQTRSDWRLIGTTLVELATDFRFTVRAAHRLIEAAIGRFLEKPDPKRFATEPPEWYRPKTTGGTMKVPKPPPVKGTEIKDEKGNARAVALDFELFEKEETPAYFEAEVLFPDVANNARAGEIEITPGEWYQMQHYSTKQRLSNLTLAKEIKRHWLLGKSSGQIATDTGYSLDTVKKYVACFTRAERASPADADGKSD